MRNNLETMLVHVNDAEIQLMQALDVNADGISLRDAVALGKEIQKAQAAAAKAWHAIRRTKENLESLAR